MSDEGRLVAGRYRITKRLGTGAMGAVWQAQDEVLARTVAVKQLLLQPGLEPADAEEARQRTMREGRIAARLHHPNAITVFDVVTDEHGQPCLIMEFLESTSLAAVLQKEKTLAPIEVAGIGAQIAAALKVAHRVGIVHRDIKPGNILLTDDGIVKITDFGISRAKDDVSVTKTGMIAGTPAYLAPEVAIGQNPGPESDIFSLGSTLYAATEGQPPFGLSENTLSLLHSVAAGHINPPRQSGPLTSVLAVLLHPDKTHRPTAEETEELLAAVARGETPIGGPVGENEVAEDGGTSLIGAGAAGLVAAGGAEALDDDRTALVGSLDGLDEAGYYPDTEFDERGYVSPAGYPEQDYEATRTAVAPAAGGYPEDEEAGSGSRAPAIIGALMVAGLIAFGIWLFGGFMDEDPQSPSQPPATPSRVSEVPTERPTTTTRLTETTTQPQEPLPQPTPEPEPPETTEPPPETTEPPETTTTTTTPETTTTTTTEPPTDTTTSPVVEETP